MNAAAVSITLSGLDGDIVSGTITLSDGNGHTATHTLTGRPSATPATGCRARARRAAGAGSRAGARSARPAGSPCRRSRCRCRRRRRPRRPCRPRRSGPSASGPPSRRRRVLPRRKFIARWIPPSSRPGTREVAGDGRARREHDRVELGEELLGGDVRADRDAGHEADALVGEQADAPRDDRPCRASCSGCRTSAGRRSGRPLEDRDEVAGLVELGRRGEPGRPAADDRDRLPGPRKRRLAARSSRSSQARSAISCSIVLIATGSPLIADGARALARRRADPPGELREVVRAVEADARLRATGRGRRGRSTRGSGC